MNAAIGAHPKNHFRGTNCHALQGVEAKTVYG